VGPAVIAQGGGDLTQLMPTDLAPLWLSLRVAALATLAIVAIGLPLALVLARGRFPGRGLLAGVLVLPLVLPPTVLGFGLLQVLGRRAPVGMWLEATFGVVVVFHWSGAVIASAVAALPLFLLPARGAIEGVDPALEDVARLLGRGEASVWLHVTLPLAWRGLAAGAVLAFARALGDFGATLMVAGDIPGRTQTASLAIYDAVQSGDAATAGRLTLGIALVSILALVVAQRALPGRGPGR
jgi:molybdate transport system permease protein